MLTGQFLATERGKHPTKTYSRVGKRKERKKLRETGDEDREGRERRKTKRSGQGLVVYKKKNLQEKN